MPQSPVVPPLLQLRCRMVQYDFPSLKYKIKPQYAPITLLTSSGSSVALKKPICRFRVANTPEDFTSDLILTLLDSCLSLFNGQMGDLESLTSFNNEKREALSNKGRKIARRIQQVAKWKKLTRFWTLTFYQELSNEDRMGKFNSFMSTLRNTHRRLGYIGVKELHKDGKLHLHLLFDQYVPYQRVREIWERLGCGKVVWVEFVPTDRVVAYVTKYITKSIGNGIKRVVLASRQLCLYLSNWPKWLMKNILMENKKYVQYFLDTGVLLEYACIIGDKKRKILADVISLM